MDESSSEFVHRFKRAQLHARQVHGRQVAAATARLQRQQAAAQQLEAMIHQRYDDLRRLNDTSIEPSVGRSRTGADLVISFRWNRPPPSRQLALLADTQLGRLRWTYSIEGSAQSSEEFAADQVAPDAIDRLILALADQEVFEAGRVPNVDVAVAESQTPSSRTE